MDGEKEILLDTSVLMNFANIDRMDLLAALHAHAFIITDHVRDEVLKHYANQFDAVNGAVEDGTLTERPVNSLEELADFAKLMAIGNLGAGECSAIATAKKHSIPLAIDDKSAAKKALKFHPEIELIATEDVMVMLIQTSVLTVEQADAIKSDWEANHRFRLMFSSFAERMP